MDTYRTIMEDFKMKRRFLSALLITIMCITFLPNIEVSATDQNMNNPKITDYTDNTFFIEKLGVLFEKLVNNQYNYFTTTGKTCGKIDGFDNLMSSGN